jgi:hypothetical protein
MRSRVGNPRICTREKKDRTCAKKSKVLGRLAKKIAKVSVSFIVPAKVKIGPRIWD